MLADSTYGSDRSADPVYGAVSRDIRIEWWNLEIMFTFLALYLGVSINGYGASAHFPSTTGLEVLMMSRCESVTRATKGFSVVSRAVSKAN